MSPQLDGDEVAHAARGHKHRRLFAKNLGRALFQPVDGGIFSVDIVSHLGVSHCPAHLQGRPRNRIAPQVHDPVHCIPRLNRVRIHPSLPMTRAFATATYPSNSTNTSFETLNFAGANRTMLPVRSTKPASANGSNLPAS